MGDRGRSSAAATKFPQTGDTEATESQAEGTEGIDHLCALMIVLCELCVPKNLHAGKRDVYR